MEGHEGTEQAEVPVYLFSGSYSHNLFLTAVENLVINRAPLQKRMGGTQIQQ
jgi:hypothetical protein